jgi:hypothetical protein
MKSRQDIVSFYRLLEGPAVATFCGLAYYAVFVLQTEISSFVNFTQGVDLFFAPAGISWETSSTGMLLSLRWLQHSRLALDPTFTST